MGGDFAPEQIVFGAVRAARKYQCEIVLVGDEAAILGVLKRESGWEQLGITVHHAGEVIGMGEHPADAVRTKKDSSIVVATQLVKDGTCDAVLSAGSTGAAVTAAQLILKRIRGIGRPTIATPGLGRQCGQQAGAPRPERDDGLPLCGARLWQGASESRPSEHRGGGSEGE